MLLPKQQRIKDPRYRKSFQGATCIACGVTDDTVVGAHIRWGLEGGERLKPSDDLILPLCWRCHSDQEANPGPEWWTQNVVKNIARRRYRRWLTKNMRSSE